MHSNCFVNRRGLRRPKACAVRAAGPERWISETDDTSPSASWRPLWCWCWPDRRKLLACLCRCRAVTLSTCSSASSAAGSRTLALCPGSHRLSILQPHGGLPASASALLQASVKKMKTNYDVKVTSVPDTEGMARVTHKWTQPPSLKIKWFSTNCYFSTAANYSDFYTAAFFIYGSNAFFPFSKDPYI